MDPEILALLQSIGVDPNTIAVSTGGGIGGDSVYFGSSKKTVTKPGRPGSKIPGATTEQEVVKTKSTSQALADFLANTPEGEAERTKLRNRLESLGYSDIDNKKLASIYNDLINQSAKQYAFGYKQSPDDLFGLFYTGEAGTGKAQAYNNLLRSVRRAAVQMGVSLTDAQIKTISSRAQTEGWDAATIGENIASIGKVSGKLGQSAETIDKLKSFAYDYGVAYDDGWYQQATTSILEGKSTEENFQQQIKDMAKSRYAGFVTQIDAGLAPRQIASPYIQTMASLLELDPNSIGLNDPTITRALTSLDDKGNPSPTPIWQFEKEILNDPRIATTKFAERNIYQKGMQTLQRLKQV
jgi:hypothetical protein